MDDESKKQSLQIILLEVFEGQVKVEPEGTEKGK